MTSNTASYPSSPPLKGGNSDAGSQRDQSLPDAETALQAGLEGIKEITPRFPSGRGPIKAIRRKCLDCTCGQIAEIDNCRIITCPLWPFRMGRNPFVSRAKDDE